MKKQVKLKDFLESWLNTVISGNVRNSTYIAYKGYVNNHINGVLGEKLVSRLNSEIIQDFVRVISSDSKKELSGKSVHCIFAMLKSALQCACDYGFIEKNPCRKIRLPKVREREVNVFTPQEQKKIETAILISSDKRTYGVLICLYTGVRLGELCALKWEDIDLKARQMRIKCSLNRIVGGTEGKKTYFAEESPKTKSSNRLLAIPEFLCSILKESKKTAASKYVISKNGRPVQPRTMQLVYARLLSRAGVRYSNFHTLRHTFATRAIELGVDVKTVGELLGHSNCNITINRYAHSLLEHKQKMMKRFDDFFAQKLGRVNT